MASSFFSVSRGFALTFNAHGLRSSGGDEMHYAVNEKFGHFKRKNR